MEVTDKDLERFWAKVTKTDTCWLWGSQTRTGYGLFRLNGKVVSAHRLSYSLVHELDDSLRVCHTCDVRSCVNPEHLFQGTARVNNNDKMNKDRHGFKLSNVQVADIRSREVSVTMCRDLSREFGVSPSEIKKILTGKTYAWLPGAKEIPPQFTGWNLSPQEVEEIIEALKAAKWGDQMKLAKKYGVTPGQITHIKKMRLKYASLIHEEL